MNYMKGDGWSRREFLRAATLAGTAGFLGFGSEAAQAQQPAGIPRIGILIAPSASFISARVEAFRRRLREIGYVEGKNIVIEYRYAEGKLEQLPDLAAELVGLKVDVIVTTAPGILAAKKASATIPIVFATAGDPVGSGYVSSLARPGGNITGLSMMTPDLDGKRLELLKEAFPMVGRVAFLWQRIAGGIVPLTVMEAAAKALGVKLLSLEVRSLDDFDNAFARAKKERAQALITNPVSLINTQQRQVLDFAAKNRLPAMYAERQFVEAGGLMSYAPNGADQWRRAADFVDKILKGTKPAEIPVEQPMKFEFVINLIAAKQIGVTIPPNVLVRANKVIR
ncbi:MAG: ABC transporter substrate-binding protein [Deltaproteobacteria bacterium]|nr:ABC transporter substrate-binding protein [Deltaproteobacteria bacterium]